MFTSKRELKKYIDRLGNDVAQTVLPAAVCSNLISEEKAQELLTELSKLKAQVHSRLAIAFDKTNAEFESPREFAKTRKEYFKEAFGKALADYEKGVASIIDTVNKAIKK